MGKKQGAQPKTVTGSSRMYPSLHQEVAEAISDHIEHLVFHEDNDNKDVSKEYSTFVMGYFRCYSPACSTRGWSSGKVTILIRSYRDDSYNAVVYKQRCEECNGMGKLTIDNASYISRVRYRLLSWAGVAQERPVYGSKKCPPHKAHLCEGCKQGICRDGNPPTNY